MEENGFIKIYRKLLESPVWANSTAKQQCILIHLLLMATWREKKWDVLGKEFTLQPGQFYTSRSKILEHLPEDVSERELRTALDRFENLSFLTKQSTNHGTLVTIVNWDKYQGNNSQLDQGCDQRATSERPANDQPINKEGKNNKNSKKIKNIGKAFKPPSAEEVNQYAQENNLNVNGNGFVDYYEAKGWMIGKNKMKDWKAAARNWSRRNEERKPKQRNMNQGEEWRWE